MILRRTRYVNPQICTPQNTICMKNHANGTLPLAQNVSKEYMLSTFFLMGHLAASNYPEGCFWLVLVALINIIGDSKRNYPEGFQSGTNAAGAQLTPGNNNLAPSEVLLCGPPHPTNRTLLQKRRFFHSRGAQPMTLEEVLAEEDSDDEADDVADLEDKRMLKNLVDVIQYKKDFMHLWNSFTRKQRVVADAHIPWACEASLTEHGKDVVGTPILTCSWRPFMTKLEIQSY